MRKSALFVAALLINGCDDTPTDPGVNCPDILRAAITVVPLDGRSGEPVRKLGTATARDGTYSDTQQNSPPVSYAFNLAHGRAGTFTVSVEIPGYARWEINNVVTTELVCGVTTVPLAAVLSPE